MASSLVSLCLVLTLAASSRGVETLYGSFDPLTSGLPTLHGLAPPSRGSEPQAYIVQFHGRIGAPGRLAVAQRAQVRAFLPPHALVVLAPPAALPALREVAGVRAVVAMPGLLKVDPRLLRVDAAGSLAFGPEEDVLVRFAAAPQRQALGAWVRGQGGEVVLQGRPSPVAGTLMRVRLPGRGLAALVAQPQVLFVAPSRPRRLLNDRSYGLVQAGRRGLAPLWERGLYGQGQLVAVADSGVDRGSCFFGGDKLAAYEDRTRFPDGDGEGHGTHVAGTIAGDRDGNGTYDRADGMAPGARLYIQDVADGDSLEGLPDDLHDLLLPAYAAGARIHSNSWGDDDNSYSLTARSVDAFVAEHRDLLVVFANGNSGSRPHRAGSPATAKNVVSVGAYDADAPDDVAYFSSHGPASDGRAKPTLTAPGVDVISARRNAACGTTRKTGTSMAAPTAAGAVALLRQYFTDGHYPTGAAVAADALVPSAALLRAALVAGTELMTGRYTDGVALPTRGQGFGRLQLTPLLPDAAARQRLWVQDEGRGLETDEVQRVALRSDAEGPLRVALVWTDPPAEPEAQRALVNDLDLVVRVDGAMHLGNEHAEAPTRPAPGPIDGWPDDGDGGDALTGDGAEGADRADRLNVEEVVRLDAVPAGLVEIEVRGAHVPLGPQPFALVVTGAGLRPAP